jgi:hypothetical protein
MSQRPFHPPQRPFDPSPPLKKVKQRVIQPHLFQSDFLKNGIDIQDGVFLIFIFILKFVFISFLYSFVFGLNLLCIVEKV